MATAYLSVDANELKQETPAANKRAIKDYGEDTNDLILLDNAVIEDDNLELTDSNEIEISGSTKLGYISVRSQVTDDFLLDMVELGVKRLNRLKTALEALKTEH